MHAAREETARRRVTMKYAFVKKLLLAAGVGAVALTGIGSTADAQWRNRYYGGYYDSGYYAPQPNGYYAAQPYGYYDEGPVYVAPGGGWYGYNTGRATACTQDQRDFAERTNFRCR